MVFICVAVAIIVYAIAVFVRARKGRDLTVVAIRIVRDIATGLIAINVRYRRISIAISVDVHVPGQHIDSVIFIDIAQTIVVHSVADLNVAWIGVVVVIITIGTVGDISTGLITIDIAIGQVAEAIIVCVGIPSKHIHSAIFINLSITVVVVPIAVFCRPWVRIGIRIITIKTLGLL